MWQIPCGILCACVNQRSLVVWICVCTNLCGSSSKAATFPKRLYKSGSVAVCPQSSMQAAVSGSCTANSRSMSGGALAPVNFDFEDHPGKANGSALAAHCIVQKASTNNVWGLCFTVLTMPLMSVSPRIRRNVVVEPVPKSALNAGKHTMCPQSDHWVRDLSISSEGAVQLGSVSCAISYK
jgi:hypothetical protein